MNVRNIIDDLNRTSRDKVRDKHLIKRFIDRISIMTDEDISSVDKDKIITNIHKAIVTEFDPYTDFAVFLGEFTPKPTSEHYYKMHDGREYYRVMSNDDYDMLKDSTGNQFWMIVRRNKIHTIFLRKSIQEQYNISKLHVDDNYYFD